MVDCKVTEKERNLIGYTLFDALLIDVKMSC